MTVLTLNDGVNEIAALLTAVFDDLLITPNAKTAEPKNAKEAPVWARLTILHDTGRQATLAGQDGASRFANEGVLVVQTFTPLGAGSKLAYDTAETVLRAYRGKRTPSDVWFRDCLIQEIGASGAWYQINVSANFIYEQRG